MGILQVLNYIDTMYNQRIPMIVHVILPRDDPYDPITDCYRLGSMYTKIIWINHQLERLCNENPNWYYLNINSIFLRPREILLVNNNSSDSSGVNNNNDNNNSSYNYSYYYPYEIRPEMIDDGVHPTVYGSDIWGPLLLDAVHKYFLNDKE